MDMEYEIRLQEFEGPFDLLLHLIKKNEIDIFDIPIAKITNQYINYIDEVTASNIELSSEFIVMASQLIYIKSQMLLPPEEDEEGNEIDPREELAQKIFEYKIFKEISYYIEEKEQVQLQFFFKDPEYTGRDKTHITSIDISSLYKAFKKILSQNKIVVKEEQKVKIETETIRIEDKMNHIIENLERYDTIAFKDLFKTNNSRVSIIVTFLALLELIKSSSIMAMQNKAYGEIILCKVKVKK